MSPVKFFVLSETASRDGVLISVVLTLDDLPSLSFWGVVVAVFDSLGVALTCFIIPPEFLGVPSMLFFSVFSFSISLAAASISSIVLAISCSILVKDGEFTFVLLSTSIGVTTAGLFVIFDLEDELTLVLLSTVIGTTFASGYFGPSFSVSILFSQLFSVLGIFWRSLFSVSISLSRASLSTFIFCSKMDFFSPTDAEFSFS